MSNVRSKSKDLDLERIAKKNFRKKLIILNTSGLLIIGILATFQNFKYANPNLMMGHPSKDDIKGNYTSGKDQFQGGFYGKDLVKGNTGVFQNGNTGSGGVFQNGNTGSGVSIGGFQPGHIVHHGFGPGTIVSHIPGSNGFHPGYNPSFDGKDAIKGQYLSGKDLIKYGHNIVTTPSVQDGAEGSGVVHNVGSGIGGFHPGGHLGYPDVFSPGSVIDSGFTGVEGFPGYGGWFNAGNLGYGGVFETYPMYIGESLPINPHTSTPSLQDKINWARQGVRSPAGYFGSQSGAY